MGGREGNGFLLLLLARVGGVNSRWCSVHSATHARNAVRHHKVHCCPVRDWSGPSKGAASILYHACSQCATRWPPPGPRCAAPARKAPTSAAHPAHLHYIMQPRVFGLVLVVEISQHIVLRAKAGHRLPFACGKQKQSDARVKQGGGARRRSTAPSRGAGGGSACAAAIPVNPEQTRMSFYVHGLRSTVEALIRGEGRLQATLLVSMRQGRLRPDISTSSPRLAARRGATACCRRVWAAGRARQGLQARVAATLKAMLGWLAPPCLKTAG